MENSYEQLLESFSSMAENGQLGVEIRASRQEYAALRGMEVFLKIIVDCRQKSRENPEFAEFRELFMQALIAVYREAKRVNPAVASTFSSSFIVDYPGVPKSCLIQKWCSLSNACLAFREVARSNNQLLMWQQAANQFREYNEFLNGLLPYLIVLYRTKENKAVSKSVFDASYANKIDQLKKLTGGENGVFYLIFKIANSKLRNAIAHGTAWPDFERQKVRYTDGKPSTEYDLNLDEFIVFNSVASHLLQPYLAALSVIAVMENGGNQTKLLLPQDLVRLFQFIPSS